LDPIVRICVCGGPKEKAPVMCDEGVGPMTGALSFTAAAAAAAVCVTSSLVISLVARRSLLFTVQRRRMTPTTASERP